jgi:hypothetical protein
VAELALLEKNAPELRDGMRTEGQLRETIQRFQGSFWSKKKGDHPPVGIYDERISLPINFLRLPFTHPRSARTK